MPSFSADNLGELGLNSDLAQYEAAPNALSTCHNVRALKDGLETIYNYSTGGMDFSSIAAPLAVLYFEKDAAKYWITASANTIFGHNGTSGVNLTTSVTANAADGWQLTPFQGLLIANSGTATPKYWNGSTFTAGVMTNLANWPASTTAKVVRAFKNFLVAIDITQSGTRYSKRILWSHPADPGAVPASWDVTDPTKDAGWVDIADTAGNAVDCLPLGDVNIIYKTDAVVAMSYVTTGAIFRFQTLIRNIGILGINCVAQFPGGHLFLSNGDVYIHDGTGRIQSCVSNRVKKAIFARLNGANTPYAFVVTQPQYEEVWICVPNVIAESDGAYTCNIAYCWNWLTGAVTTRDLPNVQAGALGYPRSADSGHLWSTYTATSWDEFGDSVWENSVLNFYKFQLVMVGQGNNNLLLMDTYDSTVQIPSPVIERTGLAIVGKKQNGEAKVDTTSRKIIASIYPTIRLVGNPTTLTITAGGQDTPNQSVRWFTEESFTKEAFTAFQTEEDTGLLANKLKFDPLINVVLPAWKITGTFTLGTFGRWKLSSCDFEINPAGKAW